MIIDDPKPVVKSRNPPLLTIIAAVVIIIGFVSALRPVLRFLAELLSEYGSRIGAFALKIPSFGIGLVVFVGGWAIELLYTIYVRLFSAPITTAISLVVAITLLVFLLRKVRQKPGGTVPPEESSLATNR